jgi:hypothetical protein
MLVSSFKSLAIIQLQLYLYLGSSTRVIMYHVCTSLISFTKYGLNQRSILSVYGPRGIQSMLITLSHITVVQEKS